MNTKTNQVKIVKKMFTNLINQETRNVTKIEDVKKSIEDATALNKNDINSKQIANTRYFSNLSDKTNIADNKINDLMNYLTSPEADRNLQKSTEYIICIAQRETLFDLPEVKLNPYKQARYEFVDSDIIFDENDYSVSENSSEDELIKSRDLNLSNLLKYYRTDTFFPYKQRRTNDQLFRKYKSLKHYYDGHSEIKDERTETINRPSQHCTCSNRCLRLAEKAIRKRANKYNDHEVIRVSTAMRPNSHQINCDELNAIRDVELISFLTFRDYVKKQDLTLAAAEGSKKFHDIKLDLTPITDFENLKKINMRNWCNNDIKDWLINNIKPKKDMCQGKLINRFWKINNCLYENKSKAIMSVLKPKQIYSKNDISLEKNSDFRISNIFKDLRTNKCYDDSDSDSSIDENYLKTLNCQLKKKRSEQLNYLRCTVNKHLVDDRFVDENNLSEINIAPLPENNDMEISNESQKIQENYPLNQFKRDYVTIIDEMIKICIKEHEKGDADSCNTILNTTNSDEFIGFSSIKCAKDKMFNCSNSDLSIRMAQDKIELIELTELAEYQKYLKNPQGSKQENFISTRNGLNDITPYTETIQKDQEKKLFLSSQLIDENLKHNNSTSESEAKFNTCIDINDRVAKERLLRKKLFLIARNTNGDFIGIKFGRNRPDKFNSITEREHWLNKSIKEILDCKSEIECGRLNPNELGDDVLLHPPLTTEERILAIEKCVVKRKQERLHLLQLEFKFVKYDTEIKSSLGMEKANPDKAIDCLNGILDLPIEQLMLTKHPHVIEMIRRLRHYIGNIEAWNFTSEQKEEFKKKAERIRNLACQVYSKFKSLYNVEERENFAEIYDKFVKDFNIKTKNMKEAQRFAVCAKPGSRQFELDQMDDQLEIEAIKLKNQLESRKATNHSNQSELATGETSN